MARVIIDESLKDKNKALVLEAFDTLFNRRNYADVERFWSPDYIQHSPHIERPRWVVQSGQTTPTDSQV